MAHQLHHPWCRSMQWGRTVAAHGSREIWSDVVCPWCYIGRARFEKAVRRRSVAHPVEVVCGATTSSTRCNRRCLRFRRSSASRASTGSRWARPPGSTTGSRSSRRPRASTTTLDGGAGSGRSVRRARLLHLARDRGIQDAVKGADGSPATSKKASRSGCPEGVGRRSRSRPGLECGRGRRRLLGRR